MKRKLTWKQAWMHVAKMWKKPIERDGKFYVQSMHQEYFPRSYGICGCISDLYNCRRISYEVWNKMYCAVDKRLKDNIFMFSLDAKGARQRAAFCLRMSKTKEPK